MGELIEKIKGYFVKESEPDPVVYIIVKVNYGVFQAWPEKGVERPVSGHVEYNSWYDISSLPESDRNSVAVGARFTYREGQFFFL